MQYKIIGTACIALLICGGIARAQVDFDQLLGTLSYDDDQSPTTLDSPDLSEELPAPNAKPNAAQELPEATLDTFEDLQGLLPNDTMEPDTVPSLLDQTDQSPSNDDLRSIPQLPEYDSETYNQPSNINSTSPSIDYDHAASPKPEPYQPMVPGSETVDLQLLVENYKPAPLNHTHDNSFSVLDSASPASASTGDCQQCGYCNRVTPPCLSGPVLPPPATNHALYRTPACYRGLWSGYAAQKQLECSQHHTHIHGTCDCERQSRCHCSGCLAR